MKEKRLITAALPYVNLSPHIGNIVGSHLPADIFSRYCRLQGYGVLFIGGTDEHGTATEIAAKQFGITPRELCDYFFTVHNSIYNWFNFSYDNFSRTSKEIHYTTTVDFFKKIYKKGCIIEKVLELPYCTDCKTILSDRYIEGTCAFCKYEHARGDQCEACGKLLEPSSLKKPHCVSCSSTNIIFRKEKHLFIRLQEFSQKLKKWIEGSHQWRKQVSSLALAWIKEGLQDRCITRDLVWGVPIPVEGYEKKVFYCWFDAPLGYISSTKERRGNTYKEYWQNKKCRIYNFIGKDNIPFHTIFFPAMLLAHGKFNLAYNVVGLQYLNYEGGKISKSKQHGVFCENLPSLGLEPDYWRFYLTYLIPETADTEFYWKEFQERVNKELIGNLGNFVNRTLSLIAHDFNCRIPKVKLTQQDLKFMKEVKSQVNRIKENFENVELRKALREVLNLSAMGNLYLQEQKPWEGNADHTMFISANLCKILGLIIQPFLPVTSQRILGMLNCKERDWKKLTEFNLTGKINKPALLFRKLEDKDIEGYKAKASKIKEHFTTRQTKMVPFEEWKKLDLRVGEIVEVKDHPNAEKLLIVKVKVGDEERQLVAGIKQQYKKEELKGKKVIVFMNLEPAKLRGVESQGMVLAAVKGDKVVLLAPGKSIESGARIE